MVRDTPPSQDASTHQIWNSYLKEYRRYGPDTKAGRTHGRTHGQTDGRTDSAITICLPKFLWGHKNSSPRITEWHHRACQVMTKGDHGDGFFYPIFTQIMYSFSCSTLNTSFYIGKTLKGLPENPEYAAM